MIKRGFRTCSNLTGTARAQSIAWLSAALLASCAASSAHLPAATDPIEPSAPTLLRGDTQGSEPGHPAGGGDQALKQANNPLANMKALNFQDYTIPELSGTDDSANTFWVRYAQPVSIGDSDWLVRASLPLASVPIGNEESESGLGDGNVFATYLFDTADPSLSFGVGPLLGAPTATEDELGTDQWSAGAAVVLFDARSSLIQ